VVGGDQADPFTERVEQQGGLRMQMDDRLDIRPDPVRR
jgi:hypothetical protein